MTLHSAYGGQSMIAPLRKVLVKRPDPEFAVTDPAKWNYSSAPNLIQAQKEHDAFTELMRATGTEVIYHQEAQKGRADALFVYDPVLITNHGAIILKMGKNLRQGEEQAAAKYLERVGFPIMGKLKGEASAEGGDMFWFDSKTLIVGRSFRTNNAGINQLRSILSNEQISVIDVDLPFHTGPRACLHLLSLISLIDKNLAVVYLPLLPVRLWNLLQERRCQLITVNITEFKTMAPNILVTAPRQCIMLANNPVTQSKLEEMGCQVVTFKGNEICLKAEAGPTCLTLPLLRA